MIKSRLSRSQERKMTKKLYLAIAGSVGLLIFLLVFGLKILINFSVLVDSIRGKNEADTDSVSALVIPPVLDPIPSATNSAVFTVSGRGKENLDAVLFLNNEEYTKVKTDEDGLFSFKNVTFKEGINTMYAILVDPQGNKSEPSATESVTIKKKQPTLEISSPEDNSTISGEDNIVVINGKTDEENTVMVNDRIAVVGVNGNFSLRYPLDEGDNTLTIKAIDPAGNEKTEERKVKYQK